MKRIAAPLLALALLLTLSPVRARAEGGSVTLTVNRSAAQVGDVIEAVITLNEITAQNITVPIHFNPAVVKVCDLSGAIVRDGVKTAAQMRDGSAGVLPGVALGSGGWNGAVFADHSNIYYPKLDNKGGFYRLLFTNVGNRAIAAETLITLRFVAVGEGDADIRFATDADPIYDPQSAQGLSYSYMTTAELANATAYPAVSVQAVTVAAGGGTLPPPAAPGGGDTPAGGGLPGAIPVAPIGGEDGTRIVEITPALIDQNLARAADETGGSMNLAITASADRYVIRIPVAELRKMADALVLTTLFDTPIGRIGIRSQDTLAQVGAGEKIVTLTLWGDLTCRIDVDGRELSGVLLGFATGSRGAVAVWNGSPVLRSRFDGTHLTFFAAQNGAYQLTLTPLTFRDVAEGNWHYGYIQSLAAKGIANGVSNDLFAPDAPVTREQFVKLLVAALDCYDETAVCDFPDVPVGAWYYPYVASAVRAGLVVGYDTGLFGTGRSITRQELAVMASRSGLGFPAAAPAATFTDDGAIGSWAAPAVRRLQRADIIAGFEDGSFRPEEIATRSQAAKIIFGILGI